MMSRTALDLWVGIFVAIGFAALVFLAMKVGNFSGINGSETYRVEAPFDNIGGLKVRAPVKSAGVLVGRVASILTSGLLGEQYVGVEAGADVEMLKSGDRVLITQSAVVLEKLIGQFMFDRAADAPPAQ